jgi:hypothetical protein
MVLGAGPQTLKVTFTPTDTTDFTTAMATVTLTVNQATPAITWATPTAITYGNRGSLAGGRGIALLAALGVAAALTVTASAGAQTAWTVNNATDANFATLETGGGFGPGTGSGNSGDLRYVLFQAMATGGANTITFSGCTVANPCKIVLGIALPPIYEATANTGATAPANFSLTIDGGAEGAVIIDGNSLGTNTTNGALTANRVFFVDNVAVTLKNLVIQNATAHGGNGPSGGGAGFGAGSGRGLARYSVGPA